MRYKQGQKEQTRQRILDAAGRSFKKAGYSGVGIDGLAKEAGVTSGAFYGNFESKKTVFSASITAGLEELQTGITHFQQEYGDDWWAEFAKFYMGQKRTCDLTESCALQSLTPEVGRSNEDIRAIFESEIRKIIQLTSEHTLCDSGKQKTDIAWSNLAMLIGGVTLARAVVDKKLSTEIAQAIQNNISTQKSK